MLTCINHHVIEDNFNDVDFLCRFVLFPLLLFTGVFSTAVLKHKKIHKNKSKLKYL